MQGTQKLFRVLDEMITYSETDIFILQVPNMNFKLFYMIVHK